MNGARNGVTQDHPPPCVSPSRGPFFLARITCYASNKWPFQRSSYCWYEIKRGCCYKINVAKNMITFIPIMSCAKPAKLVITPRLYDIMLVETTVDLQSKKALSRSSFLDPVTCLIRLHCSFSLCPFQSGTDIFGKWGKLVTRVTSGEKPFWKLLYSDRDLPIKLPSLR